MLLVTLKNLSQLGACVEKMDLVDISSSTTGYRLTSGHYQKPTKYHPSRVNIALAQLSGKAAASFWNKRYRGLPGPFGGQKKRKVKQ